MPRGLVIKSTGSWYSVMDGDQIIQCRIKGKFRLKGLKTSNPITVGDYVDYENVEEDKTGLIYSIEPRKNYIIRKAIQFHHESQLLAANIDQTFLMVSLKSPETPFEFIDRFLLSAEMFFIPVIIVVNKTDLVDKQTIDSFISIYNSAGYKCMPLSLKESIGIEDLYEQMRNKITLISGNSGVGKSSLINAINPHLEIKINTISEFHQSGKHTTTFSEIYKLAEDCLVIDSPGIKSFGVIDMKKNEIGLYFKDIFHASQECKFYNCTHTHEPGCAVTKAVQEGKIALSRYKSYVNIFMDENEKHR